MPKKIQATAQLHSSHTSKVMLKIFQVRLQQLGAKWGSQVRLQQNQEFQILKLELERQRNQRPNCQHLLDDRKSKGIPEKTLEKEMTTHSSILAWKIPGIEEPGRLQSMGLQRVRHNWVTSLSRKTSTSALLTTPKPLCGSQQTGKFFKRWEYHTTFPVSWEICIQVKKQQLERAWNRLVPYWKKSTSRLYIVTLLI